MAFKKITRNVENIQTLPDKPYLDAQVLKAEFDKGNKIIKEDFNELSGELDQYSSYVNSAYSPKARKNIVVGDELQNETLYFDFGSLTYSDLHSDAYLIYVDDNHYIKTTLKSATEAGIILKDGNTFKTLFTITNENVISVNQAYYTFSSSCGNVVEVNSSYIEYTKCYINDEDKTLSNLANIQSIGDNLTLSNSGRLDATGGGSVDIDDSSITKNNDDEIQTSGVIDTKTSATNKFWTGTLAEYNAITTKDNNTFYNITDDDVSSGVPAGGTTGQVLKKNSSTDYDTSWGTISIPTKLSDLTNDLPTVDLVIDLDDESTITYNIYGKTDDEITIDDQEVTKITFDGITLFEKESPTPTVEYVQEGLVAWFDAENNTGSGHESNVITWKNLVNNGNDAQTNDTVNGMDFQSNYIEFTANTTRTPVFTFAVPQNGLTFEIVCTATSPIGSSQAPLISNFSGVGYGLQNASFTNGIGMTINNGSWHDMSIVATNDWNTSKIYTITGSYDGSAMKGYADGTQTNTVNTSGTAQSDYSQLCIFGAKTSNMSLLSGKVYCVRCYNRALTAEEVAHNRAIDLERFGT